MRRDVLGRMAMVTGAALGIGAAVVARLLEAGYTLLAVDCSADSRGGAHKLATVVANTQMAAAEAKTRVDGCDILIDKATALPAAPMRNHAGHLACGTQRHRRNATGPCVPHDANGLRSGQVVNTGSILSRYFDAAVLVAYSTSRHAVVGLTHSLSMELVWRPTASSLAK
jgi:3-oxoacyl-[acyl-carrier protein] reductase